MTLKRVLHSTLDKMLSTGPPQLFEGKTNMPNFTLTCFYISNESTMSFSDSLLNSVQLKSKCLMFGHLTDACSTTLSPDRGPLKQLLKLSDLH
jgi:hypothetical protein